MELSILRFHQDDVGNQCRALPIALSMGDGRTALHAPFPRLPNRHGKPVPPLAAATDTKDSNVGSTDQEVPGFPGLSRGWL
jgi:hypothetical protein